MTLSGGEPLSQPAFAAALLREAREMGFHTAVETSGWADPDDVRRVLAQTDSILFDVKHMDARVHLAATGKPNQLILDNARLAAQLGVNMVIRVPVVPGFNDKVGDILAVAEFARELGISELHLLPYHRYGVAKYASLGREYALGAAEPPSRQQLEALKTVLQGLGLSIRIGG
jgi:pyruvate formate lyase activating enzyme